MDHKGTMHDEDHGTNQQVEINIKHVGHDTEQKVEIHVEHVGHNTVEINIEDHNIRHYTEQEMD